MCVGGGDQRFHLNLGKSLKLQRIYGGKEREQRSLPSRRDWRSNPDLKTSDLRGVWGGSEGGAAAAALCNQSNFLREEEKLLGGAGPMRLKSMCSA